jgi:ADP-ribosylglycohydrolase
VQAEFYTSAASLGDFFVGREIKVFPNCQHDLLMHSTHLRKDSIHGLMIGVAIGDALGLPREGLNRRTALRMFGRPKLAYRLLPGVGIYSDDTQLMLMAAQSVLRSHSEWCPFSRSFLRRLAWYPLSLPAGVGKATILAALKSWLRATGLPTGCNSGGNGSATRAMFLTLALHGTDHRTVKWIEDSTRLTHTNPLALDGCLVLSRLAQIAGTTKLRPIDRLDSLQQAIAVSKEASLREKLTELVPFLKHSRSPCAVARHFGWETGISGFMVPTTVMAAYCFLRYPTDFERAVGSAIRLGGDTDSVAAVVGGLVGAHIGFGNLPTDLVARIKVAPHDAVWIAEMAERLSHWPHGVDDLDYAPALPSNPLMQLFRNLLMLMLVLMHIVLRTPFVLFACLIPIRNRSKKC